MKSIYIIHVNDNPARQMWLLEGINKRTGVKAGLPSVGWEWIRGYKRPGLWRTRDKHQAELCIFDGVPCIEYNGKA